MITEKNWAIRASQACDVLPYVSTVTNGATLLFQAAVAKGYCSRSVRNSELGKYLANKNKLTCAVLLVPRYGNIVYVVYQLFMYVKGVTEANRAKNAEIERLTRALKRLTRALKGHVQRLATYSENIGRINQRLRRDPNGDGVEDFGKTIENLQKFLNRELYQNFCADVKKVAKVNPEVNQLREEFNAALSNVVATGRTGIRILLNEGGSAPRSSAILTSITEMAL